LLIVPPLPFPDVVAFGAGVEAGAVFGALVLGALLGSDIVVGDGPGVIIVPVEGGVGAVIGAVVGAVVWAATSAGVSASAAARTGAKCVFVIVRLTA
jgi:ABC-type xylose transport system permease subunit